MQNVQNVEMRTVSKLRTFGHSRRLARTEVRRGMRRTTTCLLTKVAMRKVVFSRGAMAAMEKDQATDLFGRSAENLGDVRVHEAFAALLNGFICQGGDRRFPCLTLLITVETVQSTSF